MRLLFASLLFATACSSAYADQPVVVQAHPVGPQIAIAIAPEKTRAPYDVQVITERGETAPTYQLKDRFYVQGNLNERYVIRITNPTARRVEAVVTVDGLDVVDGEAGDLNKRGYIIPPYGETRVEGFRTSLTDVATFRFSSVDNSYAGKKGKARNVGVIAVAIFEEQPQPEQIIVAPTPPARPRPHPRGGWHDRDDLGWDEAEADAPAAAAPPSRGVRAEKGAQAADRARPAPTGGSAGGVRVAPPHDPYMPPPPPTTTTAPRTNRPGLGTEFGEQRYSAASYTTFVRASDRPIAIAELRYNDAPGLMALGIPVQQLPDEGEIMLRETADPFPGDRFARPPR